MQKSKYNWIVLCLFFVFCWGCNSKKKIDLLVLAQKIQLTDSSLTQATAMAIHQGRVLAFGSEQELLQSYVADTQINFSGKTIYPGLIDAHCHFYGLGRFMQMVDLTQAKSFDEVVSLCQQFSKEKPNTYLLGRGWDQNKWINKDFPSNEKLNQAFPNIPVVLKRVDGHAAIVNDCALKLARIDAHSKISGGEVVLVQGKPSGVLIDNAVDRIETVIPKPTITENIHALLTAQEQCFKFGITAVTDAGLDTDIILLIDSLQKAGTLKIRINAMVSLTPQNLSFWLSRGILKTDLLQVNSFKMYGDGALGSRGACLLEPYSDQLHHQGFLLTPIADMENYIQQIANSPFQLNTHAIGDSTNRLVLQLYGNYLGKMPDRRWRIEHAQVIHPQDFHLFGKFQIVPSVQPTHATSDMIWAQTRLGSNRMKGAYAYQKLLKELGWIPLGTDFPVEAVSPFFTFYAAVERKNESHFPLSGFQMEDALSREQALLGMTKWAAKGAFLEHEMGTLAPGSFADFMVFEGDLLKDNLELIRNKTAVASFINGKQANIIIRNTDK